MGNRLSGPLATVEELVIRMNISGRTIGVQWRVFFNHLPQVKVLHLPWQVALDVVHSFRQVDQEPEMDLLPALEQVNIDMTLFYPLQQTSRDQAAIPDAFNPLIAARKKVGRSITLLFI
jgi:hypothetical protein